MSHWKRSNTQCSRRMFSRTANWIAIAIFVFSGINPVYGSGLPKDDLVEGSLTPEWDGTSDELQKLPDTTEALDLYRGTPEDLGLLSRLKNLRRLEIGGAEYIVASKSLAALTTLPLESLYIRTDHMDKDLMGVLCKFKSLRQLALISHYDKVSLGALSRIRTLEGLNLYGPISGSVGGLSDCQQLRYLRLTITNNEASDDNVLRGISSLQQLERLCIRGHHISRRVLKEVCSLPNLRSLDISDMKLTDDDMRLVAKATSLETLNLSGNPITDGGIKHLEPLKKLRALKLSKTAITDLAFESLSSFPELEELDVISTKSNADGLKYLHGQSHLRRLVLSAVLNRNLESIKKIESLEYLDLRGATIDEAGAKFISQVPGIRYLHVGRFANENVLEKLRDLGSLQFIQCDMPTDKEQQIISALNKAPVADNWMIHDLHDLRDWCCF